MALENIILEYGKGIAVLFVNHPEKLNALNKNTIHQKLTYCHFQSYRSR
jgi:enoyl-CoA hydratase/carnithine racemase